MKKEYLFFLLLVTCLLVVNGCSTMLPSMVSPDVYKATRDKMVAGEKANEESYKTDKEAEKLTQSQIYGQKILQNKLNEAFKKEDIGQIKKIQLLKDGANDQNSTGRVRYLKIINTTIEFAVEILSEPFAGESLGPGEETTLKKPFFVGIYPLTFKWYEIGKKRHGTKTVNISIGKKRSNPIRIHKK